MSDNVLRRCLMCLHYLSLPDRTVCLVNPDGPFDNGLGCCEQFDALEHVKRKQAKERP